MAGIDTPDNVRGVANAQVLLATVTAGRSNTTVGIPPSCETLVVIIPGSTAGTQFEAVGLTSGIPYPVSQVSYPSTLNPVSVYWIDATSVIDTQMVIATNPAPAYNWYVYADTAARIVAVASGAQNRENVPYVIPTIPSTGAGDHPANELQYASTATVGGTVALLGAAGANLRYRLFSAWLSTTASAAAVQDLTGVTNYLVSQGGPVAMTLPAQGYPLPTNTGLHLYSPAGDTAYCGVYYTYENV